MTNEEWVEELYNLAAEMGMFNDMHSKIDEMKKKHPELSMTEVVELSYIEIRRKYEEMTPKEFRTQSI